MKGTVVPYLIALILGIGVAGIVGYSLFATGGDFGSGVTDAKCETEAFLYCQTGSKWNPACGAVPDCSSLMISIPPSSPPPPPSPLSPPLGSFGGHHETEGWEEEANLLHNGELTPPDILLGTWPYGKYVKNMKESYPNTKFIVYRNVRKVSKPKTEAWAAIDSEHRVAEYEPAVENDWILKDEDGNYIYSTLYEGQNYLFGDVGNPGWQQFVADWIKFYIDVYDYDGTFLDVAFRVRANTWFGSASGTAINPRTGNPFTDTEIKTYAGQLHERIRETIGEDKIIISNGVGHGKTWFRDKDDYMELLPKGKIDGIMSEGIFGGIGNIRPEDEWEKSVDFIADMEDVWLVSHVDDLDARIGPPEDLTLEQWVTYVFTSTLLGSKTSQNYVSIYYHWHEDFAQRLYNADIGHPIEDYHIIESTHVYEREFSKAKVLVNPSTSSYTVDLDGEYKTLDGNTVSSITMQSHTGEILFHIGLNELDLKFYAMASYFKEMETEFSLHKIAQLYDMCQAFWWDAPRVGKIKEIKPDFKALFYRNMRSVSDVAIYDKDMYPMAVENDWLLKDISGNYITDNIWGLYAIDIGNSDYQNEVANLIKEGIDEYGYDGVFCDNSLRISAEVEWQSLSSKPINPRTGTYWTDAEVFQANVQLYKAIRNAIGPKLIAGNGIARGRVFYNEIDEYIAFLSDAKIDGVMSELMWYQYQGDWMSEQDWLESLNMLVWFQDNFLKEYPDRIFTAATKLQRADGLEYPLPTDCTKEQMATYAYASTLLGIKTNQNYLILLADLDFTIEFIQPLSNIVIGHPIEDYHIIESTHVYEREFSKAKVLVNPTYTTYIVNLDRTYQTIEDQTVSGQLSVSPHTGIILKK